MITDVAFYFVMAAAGIGLIERMFGISAIWHNSPQIVSVGDEANLDRPTMPQVFGTR